MPKSRELILEDELRKIDDYLKQDETNKELVQKGTIFLKSVEAIREEMEPIRTKIESINDKLKSYDFLDFVYSRDFKGDLRMVNKVLQDLKLCQVDNEEYQKKWQEVYERVVEVGNDIVSDRIENEKVESEDFVTYVVLLDAKDEVMDLVIEYRRRVCSRKIKHFTGEKEVFYRMLVNQEMFMWAKWFPDDLNRILSRLAERDSPLGYSKFERFLFRILCVFFRETKVEKLEARDKKEIESLLDENGRLKIICDYSKISPEAIDWFYDSLLYKSSKEYLSDGVIDL